MKTTILAILFAIGLAGVVATHGPSVETEAATMDVVDDGVNGQATAPDEAVTTTPTSESANCRDEAGEPATGADPDPDECVGCEGMVCVLMRCHDCISCLGGEEST